MRRKNSIIFLLCLIIISACFPLPVIPDDGNGGNNTPNGQETIDVILTKNVIVKYTFDDSDAKSSAGEHFDGVIYGDPLFISDTPSGKGRSIFLNGVKEQYINIPYNIFSNYSSFTISLWIKDFNTGNLICGIRSDANSTYYLSPYLYLLNDGTVSFCVCYGYNTFGQSTFSYKYNSLQASSWHHIAVTCDSPDTNNAKLSLYIDGSLIESVSSSWRDGSSGVTKTNIGGDGEKRFPVFLTAKIDEVAVYKTVLDNNVIQYIYQNNL